MVEAPAKAKIGQYRIMEQLGQGATAKVFLGLDPNDKAYAIKVMNRDDVEMVKSELEALDNLNHPNIVNMVEYKTDGYFEKGSKKTDISYIVLELADGGELIDYVMTNGAFEEKMSRFFFSQIIDTLQYIHSKGFAHRDLKPDNILLDSENKLRIADFGVAKDLQQADQAAWLKSRVGTENYMAPELFKGNYQGEEVDIFATAVILFIVFTGNFAFGSAQDNDPYYNLLASGQIDKFWSVHEQENSFSDDFKDLMEKMLKRDPRQRLSINQIKSHPWFNGPVCDQNDIQQEFTKRRAELEQIKQQEKAEKAAKKKARGKGGVHRGGQEDNEKVAEQYVHYAKRQTQFFTSYDFDTVYEDLSTFASYNNGKIEKAEKTFQVTMSLTQMDEDMNEHQTSPSSVDIIIKFLSVSEQKNCVQFIFSKGDQAFFYEQYKNLTGFLEDLDDEVYN